MEEDNDDNFVKEKEVTESVHPTQMRFEKMDRQLDQMSQQQLWVCQMFRVRSKYLQAITLQTQSAHLQIDALFNYIILISN